MILKQYTFTLIELYSIREALIEYKHHIKEQSKKYNRPLNRHKHYLAVCSLLDQIKQDIILIK